LKPRRRPWWLYAFAVLAILSVRPLVKNFGGEHITFLGLTLEEWAYLATAIGVPAIFAALLLERWLDSRKDHREGDSALKKKHALSFLDTIDEFVTSAQVAVEADNRFRPAMETKRDLNTWRLWDEFNEHLKSGKEPIVTNAWDARRVFLAAMADCNAIRLKLRKAIEDRSKSSIMEKFPGVTVDEKKPGDLFFYLDWLTHRLWLWFTRESESPATPHLAVPTVYVEKVVEPTGEYYNVMGESPGWRGPISKVRSQDAPGTVPYEALLSALFADAGFLDMGKEYRTREPILYQAFDKWKEALGEVRDHIHSNERFDGGCSRCPKPPEKVKKAKHPAGGR
jgi:hypothetical protein